MQQETAAAIKQDLEPGGSVASQRHRVKDADYPSNHQQRKRHPEVPPRAIEADDETQEIKRQWHNPQKRDHRHVLAQLNW